MVSRFDSRAARSFRPHRHWAAGVRAAGLSAGLVSQPGARVVFAVEPTLQVNGHPEVYVIGDAAYREQNGEPLPMVAPVAIQMAETVARNIVHTLRNKPLQQFRYRDQGTLATIGRNAAVRPRLRLQLSGFPAWVMWLVVHIIELIGFSQQGVVLLNWRGLLLLRAGRAVDYARLSGGKLRRPAYDAAPTARQTPAMLDGRYEVPQHGMPDQTEVGGAAGAHARRRQDQIERPRSRSRSQQHRRKQDHYDQHLGSHLPQEVGDAALQLRQPRPA